MAPTKRKRSNRDEEPCDNKRFKHIQPVESGDIQPFATPRRIKGCLKELPNMPLDIIEEVLGHLLLGDIFHLSRTNKAFRSLLMSRESARFWKVAISNTDGLPDCPDWFNEPAFANLCYSPHCHNCLAGNVQNVLWVFCVRYCKKCQNSLIGSHPGVQWPIRNVLPYIQNDKHGYSEYHLPEVMKVLSEYKQLSTESGRHEWHVERRRLYNDIIKWASACEKWYKKRLEDRGDELKNIKGERLSAIIFQLRELGWGEELEYMASQESHPLLRLKQVRQARFLTQRAWLAMKGDVISLMEEGKTNRLIIARRKLFETRLHMLEVAIKQWKHYFGQKVPSLRDIACIPDVRAIIESPADVQVTVETFNPLKEKFPELFMQLQCKQKALIREFIETKTGLRIPGNVDIFDLAISTALGCASHRMRYRLAHELLHHSCFNYSRAWTIPDIDWLNETDYELLISATLEKHPWSTQELEFSWELIEHVIRTYGEDPATATVEAMDQSPMRLCCRHSSCDSESARIIMNWISAMHHFDMYHFEMYHIETIYSERSRRRDSKRSLGPFFAQAKPMEAQQVAPLEIAVRESRLSQSEGLARQYCAHCPGKICCKDDYTMALHLRERHIIEEPKTDDFILEATDLYPDDPFYIMVQPARRGTTSGRAYTQAKATMKNNKEVYTVIGKLAIQS